MKFSGVINIDKSDVHAKGQCKRSTVKITEVKTQFEFTYGHEMMRKSWCGLWEVPDCFSRSSVNFQGHTGQKFADFDPNWEFPDCISSFNSLMATKWCIKLGSSIEEMPYCFSRSSVKFKVHTRQKINDFYPNWAFPDCKPSLDISADGYEIMR